MKAETIWRAYKNATLGAAILAPRAILENGQDGPTATMYLKRAEQADKFEKWLYDYFFRTEHLHAEIKRLQRSLERAERVVLAYKKISRVEGGVCRSCLYGSVRLNIDDWEPEDLMMRCDGCDREFPCEEAGDGRVYVDWDHAR